MSLTDTQKSLVLIASIASILVLTKISRASPESCIPNWKCEQPLNGYENDGCGNRQISSSCTTKKIGDCITDPSDIEHKSWAITNIEIYENKLQYSLIDSTNTIIHIPISIGDTWTTVPCQLTIGEIINTETNIIGDCADNNCVINKDLLIYSTFKNVGIVPKTNQIGISINDTIVKSEYITLNPNQQYNMIYNTQLYNTEPYNICGVIIQPPQ